VFRRLYQHQVHEFTVYPLDEALAKGLQPVPWREAIGGDWAITDDGYVVECLGRTEHVEAKGRKRHRALLAFYIAYIRLLKAAQLSGPDNHGQCHRVRDSWSTKFTEEEMCMKRVRPLKAIRRKCLECSLGSAKEVSECVVPECDLYPFRFGSNPHRQTLGRHAGCPNIQRSPDHTPVVQPMETDLLFSLSERSGQS